MVDDHDYWLLMVIINGDAQRVTQGTERRAWVSSAPFKTLSLRVVEQKRGFSKW